jgi:hypothetical protein
LPTNGTHATKTLRAIGQPILGKDNTTLRLAGTTQDITLKKKRLEEEM